MQNRGTTIMAIVKILFLMKQIVYIIHQFLRTIIFGTIVVATYPALTVYEYEVAVMYESPRSIFVLFGIGQVVFSYTIYAVPVTGQKSPLVVIDIQLIGIAPQYRY